jgi:flagellar protein FliS
MYQTRQALNEYRQTSIEAGAAFADPHTLISMLFTGLQENLSVAKGAMERKDYAGKGQAINKAMNIIAYLQACLDKDRGGSIAENLDNLYDYCVRRLLDASAENSVLCLDEVSGLLREVQDAWSTIRETANRVPGEEVAVLTE